MIKGIVKKTLKYIPRPWLIRASYLARPLLTWYFRGNKYIDPIDGKSFKKLLPYGYEKQRDNVLSPSTLSLERHRLLWLFLKKDTDFFTKPIKLLHFAPEQAFYHRFRKQKNLTYITTDLESPLADVKADICNLPFDDESFDWILCNHVLEHIPDDKKAMEELYRILRKGGKLICQIPLDIHRTVTFEDDSIVDKKERARIFGQYDHLRVYGMDFFDKLATVGFDVQAIPYSQKFSKEEQLKYALDPNEYIPFCTKK